MKIQAVESAKDFLKSGIFCLAILLGTGISAPAEEFAPAVPVSTAAFGGVFGDASGTAMPDLSTGGLSTSVPIAVPPSRKGMAPSLALAYRSSNGNGWVGVGWELEVGSIERNIRRGVVYGGEDEEFVLRLNGSTQELVHIGDENSNEYQLKIEGGFLRIRKITTDTEVSWEVTDKSGVRFLFGQTAASRQDDPGDGVHPPDTTRIFKWCLDRVEDTNGNDMLFSYDKNVNGNPYEGQVYLKRIAYAGHVNGLSRDLEPVFSIDFELESRQDVTRHYTAHFPVRTAHRLKSISVSASTETGIKPIGKYELHYDVDRSAEGDQYSPSSGRSLLTSVKIIGSNGTELVEPRYTWTEAQGFDILKNIENAYDAFYWTPGLIHPMDVNGDGRQDIVLGPSAYGDWFYMEASKTGTDLIKKGRFLSNTMTQFAQYPSLIRAMDINGDGRQDIVLGPNIYGYWYLLKAKSDGSGLEFEGRIKDENGHNLTAYAAFFSPPSMYQIRPMDVNGDGKQDIVLGPGANGTWFLMLSTGDGFINKGLVLSDVNHIPFIAYPYHVRPMDVNGDSKQDIVMGPDAAGNWYWMESTGDGFQSRGPISSNYAYFVENPGLIHSMDINGDGLQDIVLGPDAVGNWFYMLATGDGFVDAGPILDENGAPFADIVYGYFASFPGLIHTMDVNGDGLEDVVLGPTHLGDWYLVQSTGRGLSNKHRIIHAFGEAFFGQRSLIRTMDVGGDGRPDIVLGPSLFGNWYVIQPAGIFPDMLAKIENGMGGTTNIEYRTSTELTNLQLPFSLQVVKKMTADDGNGIVAETTYDFSGGYYAFGERDYRGFRQAVVHGPAGPDGEQTITETWFHQGNNTAVDFQNPENTADDPFVSVGYMKGKPYYNKVTDGQGNVFSKTITAYQMDVTAPYFNPPSEVRTSICDGDGVCGIQTKALMAYDANGNVTREDMYTDVNSATPYRYSIKTYSPVTDLFLGLPVSESTYDGSTGALVAQATYYYDGATDCATPSTNQTPTKGNVTMTVRRLDGITDPDARMAYDAYGNIVCKRDARGNTSTITYDGSYTFPVETATPPVAGKPNGLKTRTEYYGVDGIATDTGLYGQVKRVIDVDNNIYAATEYDTFGRKVKVTAPNLTSITTWYYSPLGTVGTQHVREDAPGGISTWTYFDGFGRTIIAKRTGPSTKTIATQTVYNTTGTVLKNSLPYFDGIEPPRWTYYKYDAVARAKEAMNPDTTKVQTCYNDGVVVAIDANSHRKRRTKDSLGRLVKVEEYLGEYTTCTTDVDSPYATTTYEYDILGNLRFVYDAENQSQMSYYTEMRYDTLGRKTYMHDPDMGDWYYTYDLNGNLRTQTDAKSQQITFEYDVLNRVTKKGYQDPGLTDVVYAYDDPAVPYAWGRRTRMTDATGSSQYYYDNMGRAYKITKTVDATPYTTESGYDVAGRVVSVKYPDNETLEYVYDAGYLDHVSGGGITYAGYAGYNALGQPATVAYGNGVTTTYEYRPDNNLLASLVTNNGAQDLLNLTYTFDNNGNITGITDGLDAARTQNFIYDDLSRLIQAQSNVYGPLFYVYNQIGNITHKEGIDYTYSKVSAGPHAVTSTSDGKTYQYDLNGNMISDGQRTIDYDTDNMPVSVTNDGVTTTFTYDGAGARVKKITSTGTIIYIGKLYECKDGTCSKYIFAGSQRIALKTATDVLYYHQDHLGSSRVVTDSAGNKVEEAYYLPFGATMTDTGAVSVSHKYTSQEYDPESGLYYYNARYYNPVLARFISPDTIISDPSNPQELNRYSYVNNNPIIYNDPSGHSIHSWLHRMHNQANRRKLFKSIFNRGTQSDEYWRRALSHNVIRITTNYTAGLLDTITGGLASVIWSSYQTYLFDGSAGDIIKSAVVAYVSCEIGSYAESAGNWAGDLFKEGSWGQTLVENFAYQTVKGTAMGGLSGYLNGGTDSIIDGMLDGAKTGAVSGLIAGVGQIMEEEGVFKSKGSWKEEFYVNKLRRMHFKMALATSITTYAATGDVGKALIAGISKGYGFLGKELGKYVGRELFENQDATNLVFSTLTYIDLTTGVFSKYAGNYYDENGIKGRYSLHW